MDLLAQTLKGLIKQKSVTKKGIAALLNITKPTLDSRLENVGEFRQLELIKIADFLNIPFKHISKIVEHEYRNKNPT